MSYKSLSVNNKCDVRVSVLHEQRSDVVRQLVDMFYITQELVVLALVTHANRSHLVDAEPFDYSHLATYTAVHNNIYITLLTD